MMGAKIDGIKILGSNRRGVMAIITPYAMNMSSISTQVGTT